MLSLILIFKSMSVADPPTCVKMLNQHAHRVSHRSQRSPNFRDDTCMISGAWSRVPEDLHRLHCWSLNANKLYCWSLNANKLYCWSLNANKLYCWSLNVNKLYCWSLNGNKLYCWSLNGNKLYCWSLNVGSPGLPMRLTCKHA